MHCSKVRVVLYQRGLGVGEGAFIYSGFLRKQNASRLQQLWAENVYVSMCAMGSGQPVTKQLSTGAEPGFRHRGGQTANGISVKFGAWLEAREGDRRFRQGTKVNRRGGKRS
ncbi:unnamed protein product [Urochloa humidicola]